MYEGLGLELELGVTSRVRVSCEGLGLRVRENRILNGNQLFCPHSVCL
jgi:hypothetical protein